MGTTDFSSIAKHFAALVDADSRKAGTQMRAAALLCEGAASAVQETMGKEEAETMQVHAGLYSFVISSLAIGGSLMEFFANILDPPKGAGEE